MEFILIGIVGNKEKDGSLMLDDWSGNREQVMECSIDTWSWDYKRVSNRRIEE